MWLLCNRNGARIGQVKGGNEPGMSGVWGGGTGAGQTLEVGGHTNILAPFETFIAHPCGACWPAARVFLSLSVCLFVSVWVSGCLSGRMDG